VRVERRTQGLGILLLVLGAAACGRRTEEARPEPVSLAHPAPQRPGLEHGRDLPLPVSAPSPSPEGPSAADGKDDGYPELEDAPKIEDAEEDRASARRPAKRRRAGSAAAPAPAAHGETTLRAKRLVVARKVEGREPVGVARSFDASHGDSVAAFVELSNDAREATKIVVRFDPPASPPFDVPLDVGASPRWRTWATTKRPLEAGTWSVRVLDEHGASIARTTFEVSE
jgi:hypothetical protein